MTHIRLSTFKRARYTFREPECSFQQHFDRVTPPRTSPSGSEMVDDPSPAAPPGGRNLASSSRRATCRRGEGRGRWGLALARRSTGVPRAGSFARLLADYWTALTSAPR